MEENFSAFGKVHDEVYARVQWGDSRLEINDWLVSEKGLTPAQAKALIDEAMADRSREVRAHGRNTILVGIGIAVVALIAVIGQLMLPVIFVWVFIVTCLVCCFGLYKVFRGLILMIGGRTDGAIADL